MLEKNLEREALRKKKKQAKIEMRVFLMYNGCFAYPWENMRLAELFTRIMSVFFSQNPSMNFNQDKCVNFIQFLAKIPRKPVHERNSTAK